MVGISKRGTHPPLFLFGLLFILSAESLPACRKVFDRAYFQRFYNELLVGLQKLPNLNTIPKNQSLSRLFILLALLRIKTVFARTIHTTKTVLQKNLLFGFFLYICFRL